MIRETVNALAACLVTFVLCAVLYPAAVWGVANVAFPHKAQGSMIERDGKIVGSELIAQPFASDRYFQPRPSAVDYKADATGGSNLGTKNPDLRKKVAERAEALKATAETPAPVDLVTASGGGLDPDITPEAARYQVDRVAGARGVPVDRIRSLIDRHINRSGAIIGAPSRVNVLALNLALDVEVPAPATPPPPANAAPAPAPKPQGAAASPTTAVPPASSRPEDDLTAVRGRVGTLSEQVDQLRERVEAITKSGPPAGLKDLERQVARLSEENARIAPLTERVGSLNERVEATNETLRSLKSEVGEAREVIKAVAASRTTLPGRDAEKPETELDLGPGLDAFRNGRFADAAGVFASLTRSHPDDARAWYLAAVANGLATNTWTGETEAFLTKGIAHERAGQPGTATIDAALTVLTKATGREWLAYHRQRAR